MSDRVILSMLALTAVAMLALALVWPQGLGRPSPEPFGHPMATLDHKAPAKDPAGVRP